MTYQPPPPPPGTSPAGPGGSFDPKAFNPLDWGILAAGVLAFIFSLFDYYTVSASAGGISVSDSASAWHGFFGWFAALLALVGAALVAAALFAPQIDLPAPARLVGLAAFAVATLFVIIALFVFPGGGDISQAKAYGVHVDEGHGFGYWASLIVIIAGTVMSLMRLQATGGQLPGGLGDKIPNIGGYGPQGGISGGTPPAPRPTPGPAQDYPPPPPPSTT
ncbi:hypothetical protein [Jatrophihabitans endophyticus]|uniref:hypothetical protein n=1 Tax=Jatrophihabitans endophyticus TaxID=1206085 RepID=UPI0019F788EC|nr:hypothetical protein [Jatrophihabitans endophyticus]MBE7189612.1 hypothetical protein [Jatrophihabitans endophyticus]